jgi:hypothetical protein
VQIIVDLSEKEIEQIRERQVFRMQWIQANMDEKEPIDFILQKVLNAADEVKTK